jgi:MFS family permease
MQSNSSYLEYFILTLSLCLGAISTALASPLYSIYMQEWQITTSQISYAFTSYMFGVVFTLLFLNGLIGLIGFKKTTMIGLVISILGLFYSAFAPNILHLCLARFLIGMSSGLLCTATLVGLAKTYPFANKRNADKASAMLTVFGFGLGPLVGGMIADHSLTPLVMPYTIIAGFSLLALIGCLFIHNEPTSPLLMSKKKIWNSPASSINKSLFWAAGISAACCFASFSLYAALAGSFIEKLPLPKSATLVGASIAIILFISAITQFTSKKMAEFFSIKLGLMTLILACISLLAAQSIQSNLCLVLSVFLMGVGHGLTTAPAYYFIGQISNREGKSNIFSSFLLIGYQGTIWPVLLCSVLIDHFGVIFAIVCFCILIAMGAGWVFTVLTAKLKAQLQHQL